MEKRGQAAMEFLMTYGWAILVVLVAIGALAYFGVLNPSRFLPSSCTITPGIACTEHKATSSGVTLLLQNGMGQDLTVNSVSLESSGATCSVLIPSGDIGTLEDGETDQYDVACSVMPTGKLKADIIFNYTAVGSTISHSRNGLIATEVE